MLTFSPLMDADHVSGARPAATPDVMWTCGNAVCWCSVSVLLCWQAYGGDGAAAGAGIKLLWADFGHARTVPGLDRHSPAAQVAHLFKTSQCYRPHSRVQCYSARCKLLPYQEADQHGQELLAMLISIVHLPAVPAVHTPAVHTKVVDGCELLRDRMRPSWQRWQ